jgi:methionine-gamma-lyase
MKKKDFSGWSSVAVHGGHQKDPNYAHLTPLYASSTYIFDSAEQGMQRFTEQEKGFIYGRWGSPSIQEAEDKIAALETFGTNVEATALLHASGMAAITTLLMSTLSQGDKLLSHYSLYGGTDELVHRILPRFGVTAVIEDLRDLSKAEDALRKDSSIKMVYLETPANPTIQCVDIAALSSLAKKYNCIVACDNTFATPYLQQPFLLGADYIIHSTTKFLNGHGTAIGGALVGKDLAKMNGPIRKLHKTMGGNSNAFDSFLLVQGMKTFELRMERHCMNGEKVAQFLASHKNVQQVNYTGLKSHPEFTIAAQQMRHPGALLSFEVKGGLQGGINFMNKLNFCTRAVSLGTCDTLLSHPASMTHFSVPKEEKERYGITEGLIRMHVGIETVQDILNDLDQALQF